MTESEEMIDIEFECGEKISLPPYVPTIEETFKASGAHQQGGGF